MAIYENQTVVVWNTQDHKIQYIDGKLDCTKPEVTIRSIDSITNQPKNKTYKIKNIEAKPVLSEARPLINAYSCFISQFIRTGWFNELVKHQFLNILLSV